MGYELVKWWSQTSHGNPVSRADLLSFPGTATPGPAPKVSHTLQVFPPRPTCCYKDAAKQIRGASETYADMPARGGRRT